MNDYTLVLTTVPDNATAERLAVGLLEEKRCACVNILPAITSLYEWNGKQCREQEQLMMIKTQRSQYQDVEHYLRTHHPYELPEVIALPIENGLSEYLAWIRNQTT